MDLHLLVDAFVGKVNALPLCFPDYAPDIFSDQTLADGRISRAAHGREFLVRHLEAQLMRRLPKSFRSLLDRYAWPPFEVASVTFYAWNDEPKYAQDDLRHAVFADEVLSRVLLENGFVQIGRPVTTMQFASIRIIKKLVTSTRLSASSMRTF